MKLEPSKTDLFIPTNQKYPPTDVNMDKFQSIYDSELQKVFVHSELTDAVHVKDSDLAQELLAQEWSNELDGYLTEKTRRQYLENIPIRKLQAENSSNITKEEAIRDLRENGDTPFLFRKYMLEYWKKTTAEWEQSWNPLSDDQRYRILIECGRHLKTIMKWDHDGFEFPFNPRDEWTWDAHTYPDGRRNSQFALKYRIAPLEHWSGHIKYAEIPPPYNVGL